MNLFIVIRRYLYLKYIVNISIVFSCFLFISLPVCSSSLHTQTNQNDQEKRCEEITVPMCRNIGYNFTAMPNKYHHDTQEEAGLEVHQFYPLVEISCSEDLRFFLCSLYTPICMEDYAGSVPACRSVCERAKQGCEPLMSQYGFAWPDHMDCSQFPVYGDPANICMDARMNQGGFGAESSESVGRTKSLHHSKLGIKPVPGIAIGSASVSGRSKSKHPMSHFTTEVYGSSFPEVQRPVKSEDETNFVSVSVTGCQCDCREPNFIRISEPDAQYQAIYPSAYFNLSNIETAGGLAPSCAASCKHAGYSFTEPERATALSWINITAIGCLITCTLTFLTYLVDSERFRYPERAIIFLSACYICIAIGYLLRSHFGHTFIACDGPFVRYQRAGSTSPPCFVSFILIYFFGMASAYWWLILTLTWFLAAGLKWGSEAITGYSHYFHLFAWLAPITQSITILCLGAIDGDAFAGICTVGNQSRSNLLIFLITPLCVCIAIGSLFLIAGFISLFRIRKTIRSRTEIRVKADTLEKLMMKIGVSSFFYIVPEVIVVGCHVYEYIYRSRWERSMMCICEQDTQNERPIFSLILLKYIMSLIIGITSSFWIWSTKTLESWRNFYFRIACCTQSVSSPSSSRSGVTAQLLPAGYYSGRPTGPIVGPINGFPVKTPTQHLLAHHYLELQTRQVGGLQIGSMPPTVPPPLPPHPPPLLAATTIHGGSLSGSQFSHLITRDNPKGPLSHV